MKRTNYYIQPATPKYPNQADRRYYEQKLVDAVTSVIAGMGFITLFCFLITM